MQSISFRVLQGADRGRLFADLQPPITIGREEGNLVQLNDERISRYHVKVQYDNGALVVTDLDSTNGTRVNGHTCNLKILRPGDTISVGRSVLLFEGGVQDHADSASEDEPIAGQPANQQSTRVHHDSTSILTPILPRGLSPGQAAELRELLDYIHGGVQEVIDDASVDEKLERTNLSKKSWHRLLNTQSEVSMLIRLIEDPTGVDGQQGKTI